MHANSCSSLISLSVTKVVVREKGDDYVVTEVMNDAAISSRKGFNLPDTYVDGAAMTPKDIKDLEFDALFFMNRVVDLVFLTDICINIFDVKNEI